MDSLPIDEIIRLREEGIKRLVEEKSRLEEELTVLTIRSKTVNEQLLALGDWSSTKKNILRKNKANREHSIGPTRNSISNYTVEQHLDGKKAQLIDLFNTLHGCILSLGIGIQVKPFKKYIGYSNNRKFCDIVVWASKLHIYINVPLAELNDPNNIAEDCSNKGHWGTMNTRFMINSISNIDYAMSLITQAYQKQIPS